MTFTTAVFGCFNRAEFLAKCGSIIEKRKGNAQIGTERAAKRKVRNPPSVEENVRKRGAEWATIENISLSPERKPALLKRDKSTYGSAVSPRRVLADDPGAGNTKIPAAADARAELADRRRLQAQDHWLGGRSTRPSEMMIQLAQDHAQKTLEAGLSIILERDPNSAKRRKLVEIVDLAKAGKTNAEIARTLEISVRTVERYSHELRGEAARAEGRRRTVVF